MDRFIKSIDKQIESSRGKNIFADDPGIFQFVSETVKAIADVDELTSGSEQFLIDYATDKAIEEFCRVNQYYSFDTASKKELRNIYADLVNNIRTGSGSIESISKGHYEKLKKWLQESNPFAGKIYASAGEKISPVACSEYSPDLQVGILQIDGKRLMQPVLDIGCGSQGRLVRYFKDQGIEICGIDRFAFSAPDLITADWLEYDYGIEKWGTIVSNLGFSNHFNHHNLREDGNYIEYGKTYMNILYSLKAGGCFHYAPDLPFIEKYLDNDRFSLKNCEIAEYDFKTTIIKRLR
jgi:hypothetical protein